MGLREFYPTRVFTYTCVGDDSEISRGRIVEWSDADLWKYMKELAVDIIRPRGQHKINTPYSLRARKAVIFTVYDALTCDPPCVPRHVNHLYVAAQTL